MSAQDLADRCAEIGHPIPRNVIANMESGRRASLPLVDVMVLAAALRTYPICLIYPVGYVDRVQQQPLEDTRPTWDAMHWFTGEIMDELDTESGMLRSFRAHANHQRAALAALSGERHERWKAQTANNAATREDALIAQDDYARRAARAKRGLRVARAFIHEDGGTPPDLPPELSDIDTQEESD